jgi:hypothetical protein
MLLLLGEEDEGRLSGEVKALTLNGELTSNFGLSTFS